MAYQIFISFKNEWQEKPTRDSEIAQELYNELKKYGIEVFFSNEEVQRKGRPDYGELINEALEQSGILMLVGTRAEFTDSRWVKYEWNLFNNEIYSARKDGKIITVLEGMDVGELPIGMRQWQSYDLRKFKIADAAKMAVNTLSEMDRREYNIIEDAHENMIKLDAEDLYQIGVDFFTGDNNRAENPDEAMRYWKAAAKKGSAKAQCSLGVCLKNGVHTEKDVNEAFRLFMLAAEQQYASAQYQLGKCYRFGIGADIDYEKSKYWYSLAAAQNDEDAIKELAEIS